MCLQYLGDVPLKGLCTTCREVTACVLRVHGNETHPHTSQSPCALLSLEQGPEVRCFTLTPTAALCSQALGAELKASLHEPTSPERKWRDKIRGVAAPCTQHLRIFETASYVIFSWSAQVSPERMATVFQIVPKARKSVTKNTASCGIYLFPIIMISSTPLRPSPLILMQIRVPCNLRVESGVSA